MIINKKSQEEGIMILASLMVLIIVLVVFGIFFIIGPKDTIELKVEKSQIENTRLTLLNYLKTPHNSQTIQDLIIRWYYDRSLEKELKDTTTSIFQELYADCYALIIYDDQEKKLLTFNNRKKSDLWVNQVISLPDHNQLTISLNPTEFYEKCNKF